MKKSIFITTFLLLFVLLSGCASKQIIHRERTENFIADVDSFEVGKLHLYTSVGIARPKIHDYYVRFAPRSNYIYIKARVGIDIIEIGVPYSERKSLNAAKEKYLADYEAGNIPKTKPNKKNAISNGVVSIGWGAFGTGHDVMTTYMTNTQYLEENKPYFRIKLKSTDEEGNDHVSSPPLAIYISPSQWDQIYQMCSQESLVAQTDEILAQANAF